MNRRSVIAAHLLNFRWRADSTRKTSLAAAVRERKEVLMPSHSFRFLHTSSFHLERPLSGLSGAPDHLRELLVNAPYTAADHVFDAALREEVDFIVLAGDLLDPAQAGPRAVAFLRNHFERLDKHGVSVYWAASETDLAEGCILALDWPANLHLFGSEKVEQVTHYRGEHAVADLLGRSWSSQRSLRAGEYLSLSAGGYQIAVMHGHSDLFNEPRQGIEYWAAGGSDIPDTPFSGKVTAHCPGSPQGFGPADTGPHGCTLVSVSADGQTRLRMIETDSVRWFRESINVLSHQSRGDLQNELRGRLTNVLNQGRAGLIHWTLSGLGRFDSLFAQARHRAEVLEWLRREWGYGSPSLWSLEVALEPPHALRAEWCEEDSILGDYMSVVQRYQEHDDQPLDVQRIVGSRPLPRQISSANWLANSPDRAAVLRQAALLGLDLLRGDDGRPRGHAAVVAPS